MPLAGVRRTRDQHTDSAGQKGEGLAGLNALRDDDLKHLRVRRSGRAARPSPPHRSLRGPVQVPRRRRGDDPDRHARPGVRRTGDHELLAGDGDGELLPSPHSLGDGHHVRRPAVGALRVGDAGYVGTVGKLFVPGPAAAGTLSPGSVAALPIGPVGRAVDGDGNLQRLSRPGVGRAPDLHYAVAGVDLKLLPGHDVVGHRHAEDGRVGPDALRPGTAGVGGAAAGAAAPRTIRAGIALAIATGRAQR